MLRTKSPGFERRMVIKMDNKKEKISWREVYALNKRTVAFWMRECPMLFVSTGIHSVVNALIPYLTLYFSARLLNELAGARRKEELIRWVIILLVAEAAALAVRAVVFRWKEALSSNMYYYSQRGFSKKLLSMDFCKADDAVTHDLLSQIHQTENWSGYGINRIYYHFQSFVEELFRMLGAVALSVSLFRLPVRKGAGWLVFLNHPLCILFLLLLMVGITVLSPYLETLGDMCWFSFGETMEFGNRVYFFCMDLFKEEKRALDMRMYRQDIVGLQKIQESMNSGIGSGSQIRRYARGRMGGLFALSAAVSRLFMGIVYLFVCLKAWGGAFGVGSVTQYIGAITALSRGLAGMLKVVGEARLNSEALRQVFAFLDIPNDMYQGCLTVEKRSDRKFEVEFRNVGFRYPHSENYVLRNLSLKFKVGQRLAVVGENGSGKTTFIKLLCRLYDPTEGEILLNGIDIRKYDYREYMNVFTVVFQDFQLLALSLGENIAARKAVKGEGGVTLLAVDSASSIEGRPRDRRVGDFGERQTQEEGDCRRRGNCGSRGKCNSGSKGTGRSREGIAVERGGNRTEGSVKSRGRGFAQKKRNWDRGNKGLWESGYDQERVVECIGKAGLREWFFSLPKGLDTVLYKDFDEDGVKISGGKAQKIAIARSLYHDAPFIILDEPTAALDPVAEYGIYTKFNEIVGDRTAIYISHRLSSCRFCDEIIVFHEGNILQQGSHEELLADREGKYAELWNAQAQYYVCS